MKEKLQEYALIAEIVGGIAIVASLVFVGIQIQQNSNETALNRTVIETSAFQELNNQLIDLNALMAGSTDLAEIFVKASNGEELSPVEVVKYNNYLATQFRHGDMAYLLFEKNIISEEQLINMLGPIIVRWPREGKDSNWENIWSLMPLNENYKIFVDNLIQP